MLCGGAHSQHQTGTVNPPEDAFPLPPHPLVDTCGGQRVLMERPLNYRDVKGRRTSYLVRWRGYPPLANSWEPRSQLMVSVVGLAERTSDPTLSEEATTSSLQGQRAVRRDLWLPAWCQ